MVDPVPHTVDWIDDLLAEAIFTVASDPLRGCGAPLVEPCLLRRLRIDLTVVSLAVHGTGTPLGDPIEVGAASALLLAGAARRQPLALQASKAGTDDGLFLVRVTMRLLTNGAHQPHSGSAQAQAWCCSSQLTGQ